MRLTVSTPAITAENLHTSRLEFAQQLSILAQIGTMVFAITKAQAAVACLGLIDLVVGTK